MNEDLEQPGRGRLGRRCQSAGDPARSPLLPYAPPAAPRVFGPLRLLLTCLRLSTLPSTTSASSALPVAQEPRPSLSQAGFPPPSSTHRARCPTRGVLPWTLRLLSLPASSDFRRHWSGSSQPAFLEAQSRHPCRQKPAPFSECTGSMAPSVPRGGNPPLQREAPF